MSHLLVGDRVFSRKGRAKAGESFGDRGLIGNFVLCEALSEPIMISLGKDYLLLVQAFQRVRVLFDGVRHDFDVVEI